MQSVSRNERRVFAHFVAQSENVHHSQFALFGFFNNDLVKTSQAVRNVAPACVTRAGWCHAKIGNGNDEQSVFIAEDTQHLIS